MKTFAEVAAWCEGAARELGDPSIPVCQLFFRWVPDLEALAGDMMRTEKPLTDLVCGQIEGEDLVLVCGPELPMFPMVVRTGPPEITAPYLIGEDVIVSYGAQQIISGVWAISPSLNAQGHIHAFVVLYDVPEPAPWERRIVLP